MIWVAGRKQSGVDLARRVQPGSGLRQRQCWRLLMVPTVRSRRVAMTLGALSTLGGRMFRVVLIRLSRIRLGRRTTTGTMLVRLTLDTTPGMSRATVWPTSAQVRPVMSCTSLDVLFLAGLAALFLMGVGGCATSPQSPSYAFETAIQGTASNAVVLLRRDVAPALPPPWNGVFDGAIAVAAGALALWGRHLHSRVAKVEANGKSPPPAA